MYDVCRSMGMHNGIHGNGVPGKSQILGEPREDCGARSSKVRFRPKLSKLTKAGALPCLDRASLVEVEALGVSSEREADSPSYWKE
jgi:hypothetical protein